MASGGSRNASLDYLHLSFAAEYSRDFETATGENRQPARRFLSPVISLPLPYIYTPSPPFKSRLPASFLVSTIFKASQSLSALLLRVHRTAKYLSRRLYFFILIIISLCFSARVNQVLFYVKIVKRNLALIPCII